MSKGFEIKGFKQLSRKLKRMAKKAQNDVMKNAVKAGLKIAKDEAKRLAPEKTGTLKRSIRTGIRKRRYGPQGRLYIGKIKNQDRNPRLYAHLVEFGTRRTKPKPFMRAALGNKRAQIKIAMKTSTWAKLKALAR